MIKSYETKDLKLNCDTRGKKAGEILSVEVDKEGNPIDRYWRDRTKEAQIDNCVEWVETKKKGGK